MRVLGVEDCEALGVDSGAGGRGGEQQRWLGFGFGPTDFEQSSTA